MEIAELFLKWLIPFLCGSAVSILGTAAAGWKSGRKKGKALENGVQSLLRAEIIRSYEKYMDKQYCPLYAREALKREYDSYHQLGGNDVATELYQKICLLPTEPPENICKTEERK